MKELKSITRVARDLGIAKRYLELYGEYKAKISLGILRKGHPSTSLGTRGSRVKGQYILVSGITPTPLGEGKTVTTIGLGMALARLGKKAVSCLREPSLGPFLGVKGGGTGGGHSQIVPAEDINLHMTGDFHAVSAAHNLCAAFLDNRLFRGNELNIDPDKIFWRRVVDINDRSLRKIKVGVGGGDFGVERETGFDITAASELMAILALAESIPDLRKRISRIVVALAKDGRPVTCEDLKVAGVMAALLRDAIKPNLVQTSEGTPSFVHTGPFANITHGNSSVIADKIALEFADFVVTEGGFGADCGAEKFFDIKCRSSGLEPDAVVLVCSVRALKMHSGKFKVVPGKPLDKRLEKEDLAALEKGCANLEKQIENIKLFGIPCVVAINRFKTDTARELEVIEKRSREAGAAGCAVSELYSRGSKGGGTLAKAVIAATKAKRKFRFLYPLNLSIKEKIDIIAKKVYGARGVHCEPSAEEDIARFERLGFGKLPVCMAKTHLSLSHDPNLKGSPRDYTLPVREVRPAIGAGFLSVLCGKVMTMPSLPSRPMGELIDIDSNGRLKYVHR